MSEQKKSSEIIEVTDYEILNVTFCSGIYAIHHKPSKKGEFFAYLIDAVGVAKPTTTYRERGKHPKEDETVKGPNHVVGLQIADGVFQVCDEDAHFMGLYTKSDHVFRELRDSGKLTIHP